MIHAQKDGGSCRRLLLLGCIRLFAATHMSDVADAWIVSPKYNAALSKRVGVNSFFLHGSISLEDQYRAATQRTFRLDPSVSYNVSTFSAASLVDAAASITQASFPLLGIKSLGVDYGLVRTGIASTVGYNPQPLDILTNLNNTQVCHRILHHARSQQSQQIIVGLPLHKNGTIAAQTNLTLIFAKELTILALQKLNVPVILWDERYTSKEAAARAHAKNPDTLLYGKLDADAACIILEQYYKDVGVGAQQIELDESMRAECLLVYKEQWEADQRRIQQQLKDREDSMRQRREAMERAKRLDAEAATAYNPTSSATKKKKRKKKR
jgi:putative transcription antitermination factor YqgF